MGGGGVYSLGERSQVCGVFFSCSARHRVKFKMLISAEIAKVD